MKTSNKIISGFFIVVFLVPLFILLSFNSQVKKDQFTLVERNNSSFQPTRKGSFAPFKVIKINAPSPVLTCTIRMADSLSYAYASIGQKDSIQIYNQVDTLFIQYINPEYKGSYDDYGASDATMRLHLKLSMPAIAQLIVNNAEVTMVAGTDSPLLAEVYGAGKLNLGKAAGKEEITNSYRAGSVSIRAINGTVTVGDSATIRQLQLQTGGNTVVQINDNAAIDQVNGHLSDSTTVNGSWKIIKRLTALNN